MRFWVYIPPHDALCPSNVPPKISLKTANLLMREGQYIRVQSIKKSPQTQSYQGFASLQGVVPVAGVEPARGISPQDFESSTSANSITPAQRDILAYAVSLCKHGYAVFLCHLFALCPRSPALRLNLEREDDILNGKSFIVLDSFAISKTQFHKEKPP